MNIDLKQVGQCGGDKVANFIKCNKSQVAGYISKIESQIKKKFDKCCLENNSGLASEFGEHILQKIIEQKLCEDSKGNTKRIKSKKIKDLSMTYEHAQDDKKLEGMMNRFGTLIDGHEYECIEHLLIDDDVPTVGTLSNLCCPNECSTC